MAAERSLVPSPAQNLRRTLVQAGRHLRRWWPAWTLLVLAGFLFQQNYRLTIQVFREKSLPGHLFLVHYGAKVLPGDAVVFEWNGAGPYPRGMWFGKRVVAGPGDLITRQDRDFYVNGRWVAHAHHVGMTGTPLEPAPIPEAGQRLAPCQYFVLGTHDYSLDSRYALTGLIGCERLVGKLYVLF